MTSVAVPAARATRITSHPSRRRSLGDPGNQRKLNIVDADSLDVLDRAARAAHLSIRFSEDGRARLEPEASGLDGALGRIVAVAFTAMADGSWNRLKACRRNVCHWVFYDRSRNHSSTWCAMSVCGNRTKTMAYRRRSARGRTS